MNALILRGIRQNLRPKHLIAAGLFSLIVCSTAYMTSYLEGELRVSTPTIPRHVSGPEEKIRQSTGPAMHLPFWS